MGMIGISGSRFECGCRLEKRCKSIFCMQLDGARGQCYLVDRASLVGFQGSCFTLGEDHFSNTLVLVDRGILYNNTNFLHKVLQYRKCLVTVGPNFAIPLESQFAA
jgi:hypothetical protein